MNREPIHAELFRLVSSTSSFNTKSRKLQHWDSVPSAGFPAIFQAHLADTAEYAGKGLPPKWVMKFEIYVYVRTATPGVSPSELMNPILDSIEDSLLGMPDESDQTLTGLVSHCRISGTVQTDEGTLGDLGVAIIPIEVVL